MARISQVASSTPFLCCSRFSPIAFNLSNTKSSIQLLLVPDCPFRRLSPFDRIQRDRPYTTISTILNLMVHSELQNCGGNAITSVRIGPRLNLPRKQIAGDLFYTTP